MLKKQGLVFIQSAICNLQSKIFCQQSVSPHPALLLSFPSLHSFSQLPSGFRLTQLPTSATSPRSAAVSCSPWSQAACNNEATRSVWLAVAVKSIHRLPYSCGISIGLAIPSGFFNGEHAVQLYVCPMELKLDWNCSRRW